MTRRGRMGHRFNNTTTGFGSLVRMHRHEAGMTQRELAAKAGLSIAALRDIEQSRRHRPRANSLAALADALSLDPDQAASLGLAAALPRQGPDPAPSPLSSRMDLRFSRTVRSSGRDGGLWLALLGPLEAWGDGTPLSLGPPARRAVLGLLLVDP